MRPGWLAGGAGVLATAWLVAASGHGMTAHMLAHMAAVAVAAPLIAAGLSGSRGDPAVRWPRLVAPQPMSLVELVVVWSWHAPAARAFAAGSTGSLVLEQLTFFAAGFLLWAACLGGVTADSGRRAAAVLALLLTTMHMTLLGVLITLAPRPLYATGDFDSSVQVAGLVLSPLADQQLGGVIMLIVGAGSYLACGLLLLARLLRSDATQAVRRWS